jgi:hypothetical protein
MQPNAKKQLSINEGAIREIVVVDGALRDEGVRRGPSPGHFEQADLGPTPGRFEHADLSPTPGRMDFGASTT